MRVLVLNSGSSSIKYKLYETDSEAVLTTGAISNIGGRAIPGGGRQQVKDHGEGPEAASDGRSIDAIGHRVVHGGPTYSAPVLIDEQVCKAIADYATLAPLHNPPNLQGIEAARRLRPETPQVAVFDTAFHTTIPDSSSRSHLSDSQGSSPASRHSSLRVPRNELRLVARRGCSLSGPSSRGAEPHRCTSRRRGLGDCDPGREVDRHVHGPLAT
jgi:acetate kinase